MAAASRRRQKLSSPAGRRRGGVKGSTKLCLGEAEVIMQKGRFQAEGSQGGTRGSELPNQDTCRREASGGARGRGPKWAGRPGFELGSSRSHKRSSAGERQGETQGETDHSGSPWTGESQRQETLGPARDRGRQDGEEETLVWLNVLQQGTSVDAGEDVWAGFSRPGGEGGRRREVYVTSQPRATDKVSHGMAKMKPRRRCEGEAAGTGAHSHHCSTNGHGSGVPNVALSMHSKSTRIQFLEATSRMTVVRSVCPALQTHTHDAC